MFDGIRNGRNLYSPAHQRAWMPRPIQGTEWHAQVTSKGSPPHASLMAPPAFAAMGFDVQKVEFVQISWLEFPRAEMVNALR